MAYLYRHIRLDKNEPFYIGIGGLNSKDNYARSKDKFSRNIIWKRVAAKTNYVSEVVLDNLSSEDVLFKEKEFIKLYGRIDNKTGTLANMTDGGEGTSGHIIVFTEDHKNKISLALTGKKKARAC